MPIGRAWTCFGFLGSQDAAKALRLLPPGTCMAGYLDQDIRLRNVNGVVPHLGQKHRVDLQGKHAIVAKQNCPGSTHKTSHKVLSRISIRSQLSLCCESAANPASVVSQQQLLVAMDQTSSSLCARCKEEK